jgi:hypothetical protein
MASWANQFSSFLLHCSCLCTTLIQVSVNWPLKMVLRPVARVVGVCNLPTVFHGADGYCACKRVVCGVIESSITPWLGRRLFLSLKSLLLTHLSLSFCLRTQHLVAVHRVPFSSNGNIRLKLCSIRAWFYPLFRLLPPPILLLIQPHHQQSLAPMWLEIVVDLGL